MVKESGAKKRKREAEKRKKGGASSQTQSTIGAENDSSDNSLNSTSNVEMMLQMERLEAELFDLRDALDKTRSELSKVKDENASLRDELLQEKFNTKNLSIHVNNLEQYSRKNNIRIFGVKDNNRSEDARKTEELVIDICRNKLGLDILPGDIQAAHRIGKFVNGADRAIIVQFVSKKAKMDIISKRRLLKGHRVSISEDLSVFNLRRLDAIKNLSCVAQSWFYNGRLFAKNKFEKVKEVRPQDIICENLFVTTEPARVHTAPRSSAPQPMQHQATPLTGKQQSPKHKQTGNQHVSPQTETTQHTNTNETKKITNSDKPKPKPNDSQQHGNNNKNSDIADVMDAPNSQIDSPKAKSTPKTPIQTTLMEMANQPVNL